MRPKAAFLLFALLIACGSGSSVDPAPQPGGPAGDPEIVFRILVPESTPEGSEIWISGNLPSLGAWNGRGLRAEEESEGAFVARERIPLGTFFEFKVTRGSWATVEKSETGAEIANRRHRVEGAETLVLEVGAWRDQIEQVPDPTLTGDIRYHRDLSSQFLPRNRDVIVYLPPGYETSTERYPVLYMHDGQNIFDRATSFLGIEWEVDETAERLIGEGEIDPLIVVGVYNTPDRTYEYTQVPDPGRGAGGGADLYGRFLTEELKPLIDSTYRTLPGREHTGVAGSSLGGLVSMYFGLRHSEVFSRIGAISPAVFWADGDILQQVARHPRVESRVWVDIGTREGSDPAEYSRWVEAARDLRDALVARGWVLGEDLEYFEDEGAVHNEAAWAGRFEAILKFLYPVEVGAGAGSGSEPVPAGR